MELDVIALRRDLHAHPEVGFTEFRTAAKVVEILLSLGYEVQYGEETMDGPSRRGLPSEEALEEAYQRALRDGANPDIVSKMRGGYTAVIGVKKGQAPGPTVGFRFDMDALPIRESADADHAPQAKGFRSVYEGSMHACAHDGHTAVGLGLAAKLADGSFHGTVKLIFQPAEEGVRGAYAIVQKGCLDDVDYLFCHHQGTDVPTGEFHGGGQGFLASTKLAARFYGVSSHAGASPEKGRNALLGAATALMNIHALPRFSTGSTRVNVGVLEGGTAANIVPEFARMVIETRSVSEETNNDLEQRVRRIIAHSAEMHELRYEIDVIGAAIPIRCDEELVQLAMEEARQVEGFHTVKASVESAMGSEDASFMIRRVQEKGGKGTYMIIGSHLPAPHHHPKFDIEEEILPRGVELLSRIARRVLT
ncbi:amidohydrolase [Paenibacillus rigui]|uniref:Aminobenzoyl-glutamate utilization protein A n=1 Tax=Paenibacillus rigui TaxID=554312 RepID=A0A229UMD1_9BACL|nr:amidohydrolase [Paenibacillus rigui]OXM84049.1 aminobenzoyl-glutamate utilization protein A [Paenibacillus rigui]